MSSPHPFLPGAELEPGESGIPQDGVVIDLSRRLASSNDAGVGFQELPDGGMEIDFGDGEGQETAETTGDFDDNLAEGMTESQLAVIAAQILEWVDIDVQSREPWQCRIADGMDLLGVTVKKDDKLSNVMKLVEKVSHPLIAEAQVQFQARAIAELVPPTGPAKAQVLGNRTEEVEQQAERVGDYLNYQLMVEDEDYYPETDRMLFVLSGAGSQFKKVYRDPILARSISRWIRTEDFIVPYGAVTLESAPRYTHQIPTYRNDMRKLQVAGFYRDIPLSPPTEGRQVSDRLKEKRDEAQGQEQNIDIAEDMPHTVLECHCEWDLEGFEDKYQDGDDQGKPTKIGLPYVIAVDKDSRTVLSIRRNWKEGDEAKRKRMSFVHFPMIPGDGFYSYGFWHLIGGLGQAATGLLKIIMVGAAFASMQGGFKAKGSKSDANIEIEWGVYKDVDMSWEELNRAFYTPPFKEPSEALFKILGVLETAAERMASTTESMVGDASNTGPVGTTVALIEQGSKVYTGIHKRLHYAQSKELKLLAELNGEYVPAEGYPYAVAGADREILGTDFDDRVDVVPVSDPNIFSSTQRIAIAQTLVQRADAAPGLYRRRKVEKRYLEAVRVADPDEVLASADNATRADPVTENAMMLVGEPVKVYVDQDHDSHQVVHQSQIDAMSARPQGDPIAQRVLPVAISHLAEHMAMGMRVKLSMAIGIPLPPMQLDPEGDEPVVPQMPPQMENMIAQRAASVIAQMPKPQGGDPQAQQQAEAMQKQAQAMQAQAEDLKRQRDEVGKATEEAKRVSLKAAYDKQVAGLTSQLATLRTEMAQMKAGASTQALLDEAINRVEKAIEGLNDKGQANG